MAGLLKNNKNNQVFLNKWYQFLESISSTDIYANTHWKHHWPKIEQLALHSHQHESWKQIPLDSLLAYSFTNSLNNNITPNECNSLSLTFDAYRLVFIDGRFIPNLSDQNTGNWQVKVEQGTKRQSLPVPIYSEFFLHLTESLSREITSIRLAASEIAQKPLYLLHISQANENKNKLNILHYRHHIQIEHDAQGQVIEHFVSLAQQHHLAHFSSARMTIDIRDHAYLSHLKLACEKSLCYHFAHNDITVGNHAVVRDNTFLLGSSMTQHQTSVQLNGEASDILIKSLLLSANQDINEICTYLEHNEQNCLSNQLHKVIAFDGSKGVFNGKLKVAKHALKTNGKMVNNNLLLGNLAEVYSKPQLEIYTDDVKCSHGATVGYIDADQIFYLRSRGFTYKDAQKTIIFAFAADIIDTSVNKTIQEIVLSRITEIFKKNRVTL